MIKMVKNIAEPEVLGSLPGRKKGWLRSPSYTLVFAKDKTILARRTSKLMKAHAKEARKKESDKNGKTKSGGWLQKVKGQMHSHYNYHRKYLDMSEDEILNEHKDNFSIDNRNVKKVKIRRRAVNVQDFPEDEIRLKIKTSGKSYKFILDKNIGLKDAKALLKQVYGSRLT